jgi:hypothetical protein
MVGSKALIVRLLIATCILGLNSWAFALSETSLGQIAHVPVYSYTYAGPKSRPLDLTVTLSIRNTDISRSIVVDTIDYYGSDGRLIKKYVGRPLSIAPMAGQNFIIRQSDRSGGSNASFVVKWNAKKRVSPPIIQAVHISATSGQGISFITSGRIISEQPK